MTGQEFATYLDLLSELIREVGASYEIARRYRQLAGVCEERYLAPALEAASMLRRIARAHELDRELFERQIAQLRQLRTACAGAIDAVRESDLYRRARAAWHEGRSSELRQALPDIFAWIAPEQPSTPVHYPVSLRRPGAERGEHFIRATVCADRVAALAREGIPADSAENGLGTDAELQAVRLAGDPNAFESPVSLRIEPAALSEVAVCRLSLTGDFLVYVPRLGARFEVFCARTVDDEWWNVRTGSYPRYLQELWEGLTSRGVPWRAGM